MPERIAQTGSGGVPGIADADFESFETPLLSDSGDVIVHGELVAGVGGVTASDSRGIWSFDGVTSNEIARSGSAGVPGIVGASFDDFEKYVLNSAGQIALKASLQLGGAVGASNDSGLWLMDSGGAGVLIAQEGDNLAGRTIASLDFVGGSGGNDGSPTALNDLGNLLFSVDFTNGDSGLFLFQNLKADFDGDGDVDSNDLTHPTLGWEARYGVDLNGLDFLDWQQEFGTGIPLTPNLSAVPEPNLGILLLPLLALIGPSNRWIC